MDFTAIAARIRELEASDPNVALRVYIMRDAVRVTAWGRADIQSTKELSLEEAKAPALKDADDALEAAFTEVLHNVK